MTIKQNFQESSCRNLQNDSAEQEQPLRDCPSQRFNKPDSYHNLFIVSWITRKLTSTRFQKSN
ncbi:hypothetical protein T09_8174 [Trichinella sp. T9]|nr:hypothetical protein T09_8174 [Trichinella sp. T9]